MKRRFSGFEMAAVFAVILSMIAVLSNPASAQSPSVSIFTDKDSYVPGETIEVSLAGENPGLAVRVDVYVGLLSPDGSVYTLRPEGWAQGVEPWITNLGLPKWFEMSPMPLWSFELPSDMPLISSSGQYRFGSILTTPGSLDWIWSRSFWPFYIDPAPSLHFYVSSECGDDLSDGSEQHPWRTITHALVSVRSSPGNPVEIHVAPGTYSPSSNGETFPLYLKSWVSVMGQDAETTIADAEQTGRVIYCDNVYSLTIEGLTITGGSAYKGAGIYCSGGAPLIQDNMISGNEAERGGAICSDGGGSPRIESNTITGNAAEVGAGILLCTSFQHRMLVISGNTISGNSALGSIGLGGAIFLDYTSVEISNNVIVSNYSSGCGGGIAISRSNPSTIISSNLFAQNVAMLGGAVYIDSDPSPTISNNVIAGNSATCGGAIYCYSASPAISNNTITQHRVAAAIECCYGSDITIVDCIFWDNGMDVHKCWATYSCVHQLGPEEGNIHEDPMFVSGPLGDYYLDPQSPCIDAGSRSAEEAGLSGRTTQADGTLDTGRVDMGFHYPASGSSGKALRTE